MADGELPSMGDAERVRRAHGGSPQIELMEDMGSPPEMPTSQAAWVWLVHCNNALLEVCRFRSGAEIRAKAERALIGGAWDEMPAGENRRHWRRAGGIVANVVIERHEVTGA